MESIIREMNKSISHRGPDSSGVWIDRDQGVYLGHQRLSILDCSPAGHQPMQSFSGRFVLVYNGEIYNHLEIRDVIEDEGGVVGWKGHSDTETLLAAIERW